jgi:membrane associated rhomboid family serine protease
MNNTQFSGNRYSLRPRFTGAVRALILVNVAIFFIQFIVRDLVQVLGLVPALVIRRYYLWQLVTYMFLHGSFLHLGFNMFILWMFGSELEARWGRNEFLRFYFITGIGAGLVYALVRLNSYVPTIGASGAIFGLLLAYGLTFPNRYVYLYFFIPIKAKFLVIIFGALEFFAAFAGARDNIAHFAHLGGLAVGLLYMKLFKGRMGFWRRLVFTDRKQKDADIEVDDTDFEDKVNDVLRKLSKVGLDGLSSYEKEILEQARKRYRDKYRR